ncbi:sunset domain-containing protein [Pseudarthrobacter sp. MM222]|uniref:sunset domain-containing protein n=1 Tax=Pseudarthrobacter sp. MM222 TaxID=3018929 RepID=UPI002220B5D3|nr:hypothetical protein [Pseudarthrobacter sp. MM222]CAI3800398.1 hypothetical protein NKCBBBOE_02575 [Pseudarthrobacter sp. MM222]
MDWIIWLIVIVAIVAIVWWLLNRNSRSGAGPSDARAGTETGAGTVAGTGTDADVSPLAPPSRGTHDGALSGGSAAASAAAAGTTGIPSAAGFGNAEPVAPRTTPEERGTAPEERGAAQSPAEWETQWSETAPAEPHAAAHHEPSHGAHATEGGRTTPAGADAPAAENAPVHHREYTDTHAPTLPGAESAAAEAAVLEEEAAVLEEEAAALKEETAAPAAPREPREPREPLTEAETLQSASSSAVTEGFAAHTTEPSGHLAQDQPYGEGSAAPAADGSGPEGFTVKGNASSMIYHDESSPSYDETVAEVWFVSIAHAEAAGFRPPRRSRL